MGFSALACFMVVLSDLMPPVPTLTPPPISPFRRLLQQPRSLTLVFGVAIMAWVAVWVWQARYAPVARHIEAGQKYFEQGRPAEAANEWLQAVQLDPHNATAWELLGDYYSGAKNWPAAREAYERVARLQPDTPQLFSRLAVSIGQMGDVQTAQRHATEAIKRDPNDVDALYIVVTLLGQSGLDEALRLEYLRRLVKLEPDNSEYLGLTTDALILGKQFREAKPLVERLLKLNPNFAPAYAMRGSIILNSERSPSALAQAEADFRKALQWEPHNLQSRRYLAKVLLRRKLPTQAIQQLEIVQRAQPRDFVHLHELAIAYQHAGDIAKATFYRRRFAQMEQVAYKIKTLKVHVKSNPKDFESMLQLGTLLSKSHNPKDAEKYLQKALALRPTEARAKKANRELERRYQNELLSAMRALQRRDYESAGQHISVAFLLHPRDERTRHALQQIAAASGDQLPQAIKDLGRTGRNE
ncbi:MAG: hypothetical protein JWN98_1386 [Abditibacteriota bacterium]|nr:hypothetical protein [Abditibacteriota bacterium]